MKKKNYKYSPDRAIRDKNRAIIIVSLSILILSSAIIFHIFHSHENLIENIISSKNENVRETFVQLEENSYNGYKVRIEALVALGTDLVELFAQKDRVRLYEKILPLYENLKKENPYFYVMHFHLAEGTTLLRMHNPDVYGDKLHGVRPIIDAVHQNQIQRSGFDIGRHGPFFRIVQPVFYDNKYIGCLELGIKVHQLLQLAEADLSGLGGAYFLRDEWNKVTNTAKHFRTIRPFGKFVLNTHDSPLFKSLPDTFDLENLSTRIDLGGNNYIFYSWPIIKDFEGKSIGGIVVLQDVSALVGQKNSIILNSAVIIIFLTSLSLITLFLCLNKLTKNITEYHQKLQENEMILLNAQKIAHIGSWQCDLQTESLFWSDEVCRIFGLSPGDCNPSYEKFIDAVYPEDRQLVDREYQKSLKNNTAYDVTHRIIRPDGEVRIVHQKAENIMDSSGAIISLVGMIHDITDFKNIESSLRQSKKQWEKTFDSIQDIITVQDCEMHILKMNQAGRDFFEISSKDAVSQSCYALFHGNDEPCPRCPLLATKETFTSYCEEITHEKLGRTFLVSASAILDEAGELANIIHVAKDITEKKKIENQIFLNEKLATIAGLAAGVAHEVNNPLSIILQSHQLIKMRLNPDNPRNTQRAIECGVDIHKVQLFLEKSKVLAVCENSVQAALKAADIIKSLLEFSRPHLRDVAAVDVVYLVETSLKLSHSDYSLKRDYDFQNVSIETTYDPALTTISCVVPEIEQVLLNLIQNSAHSLAKNKIKNPIIRIKTSLVDGMAQIEIEDNGPGIDENIRAQIFDPFFTTKKVGEGTGLGLFVSHTIVVDKHKGNLRLESEPGNGAKFIVELPIIQT